MPKSRESRLIANPLGSCPVHPPTPLLDASQSAAVREELKRLTDMDEVPEHADAAVVTEVVATDRARATSTPQSVRMCYNNECFSEDALRSVFDAMVESSGSETEDIDLGQFVALCRTLELGLSEVEIGRVWNQLGVEVGGSIGFQLFAWAIQRRKLLRRIVSAYLKQDVAHEAAAPADYDYSQPTCVNYAEPGCHSCEEREKAEASSTYAKQRALADYGYHPLYTRARRRWQDEVVRSIAVRTEAQSSPWIVYTCGPFGAGKGYVLHWLSERGYFPLEEIVHVDPDGFKILMPEFEGYVARDRDSAGSMTHRESGFLAELAQEAAMERRQHIWVDGSLRDARWFEQVFRQIRSRHPVYRVAIFYINASAEVAWRRTLARAAKTGRAVPKDLFERSMDAPAESLRALTPYVDFLARLDNQDDGQPPKLVALETVDSSGDLSQIRRMMLDSEPDAEFDYFPARRGPLRLARCDDDCDFFELIVERDDGRIVPLAKPYGRLRAAGLGEWDVRAPALLNWDAVVRKRADVPSEAMFFCIVEPRSVVDGSLLLAAHGGLAYLDLQLAIARVVAFCSDDKSTERMLRFHPPVPLAADVAPILRHRWRPLPPSHGARDAGATAACWLAPCEDLAGHRYAPFGGQVFLFGDTSPEATSSGSGAFPRNRQMATSNMLLYPLYGKYDD